jgi:NADPH:quinone reductase
MAAALLNGTMLEAHVSKDTKVAVTRVPIPKLQSPDDVLVKVNVAGCNPKDWKMPAGRKSLPFPSRCPRFRSSESPNNFADLYTILPQPNSGDDISGTIAALGNAAPAHLHVNQRVAALHELGAPHGAYAEYALVKAFACIPLPDSTTFEEAATLPMAAAVSTIALFARECLDIRPAPWLDHGQAQSGDTPLLIYGASTQVGAMAIKLARRCGIRPLLCVAGKGGSYASSLLDETKGDVLLDYRQGSDALVGAARKVLGGRKCLFAFDAVSNESSFANVTEIVSAGARVARVLVNQREEEGTEVQLSCAMAGSLWKPLVARDGAEEGGHVLGIREGGNEFSMRMSLYISRLLEGRGLRGHPYEVVPGGLVGLEVALNNLKEGKNSALKYVVRIGETKGMENG